ncbi:pyridoxine/pyridoxamine 5'-phosphate oxidase [Pseudalkalibacillus decolorationis]|uniref:pyridoxine/pyridoxamine 5'-phosphate oxidase n=1 Tax=Pseudalkalibacillus decolorationis TaxID=163879 RepID=UPI002147F392|nr:pyridoxal 5'-phosphate synthase [Pseudalkalibacillus decolorationis]
MMRNVNDTLRSLTSFTGPFSEFHPEDVPGNPTELFIEWLYEAIEKRIQEPHAMTLSTVDKHGVPDARTLILKNVTRNKWFFATSCKSQKGKQLELNPRVALTFYWSELGRQVRIRGIASVTNKKLSDKDFLERSVNARAIALIGRQSEELIDQNELDDVFIEKQEIVKRDPLIVAPYWHLYSVFAEDVEFFQGNTHRKNVRVKYERKGEQWASKLLWP